MRSNLIDLEVYVHFETEKAYLVSDDGERDNAIWFPKSQCELEYVKKPYATLTCEEWLAQEKELI